MRSSLFFYSLCIYYFHTIFFGVLNLLQDVSIFFLDLAITLIGLFNIFFVFICLHKVFNSLMFIFGFAFLRVAIQTTIFCCLIGLGLHRNNLFRSSVFFLKIILAFGEANIYLFSYILVTSDADL